MPAIKSLLVQWVFAVKAYSVCIKNLEGITASEKQRHLRELLRAWGAGTTALIHAIGVGIEQGEVDLAGVKLRIDFKKEMDGWLVRRLLLCIPAFVSSQVKIDLGSEKLEQPIAELENRIQGLGDFIRVGLMADLRTDGFLEQARSFMTRHAEAPFLIEAMMIKLRETYLRYGMTDVQSEEFVRVIANASADLLGLKGKTRQEHIARALQDVGRQKLMASLH